MSTVFFGSFRTPRFLSCRRNTTQTSFPLQNKKNQQQTEKIRILKRHTKNKFNWSEKLQMFGFHKETVEFRRLSATPAWSDFLVVVILSLLLFGLLYYLIRLGYQWQQ